MCILISSLIKRPKIAFSEQIFLKIYTDGVLEYEFKDNKGE